MNNDDEFFVYAKYLPSKSFDMSNIHVRVIHWAVRYMESKGKLILIRKTDIIILNSWKHFSHKDWSTTGEYRTMFSNRSHEPQS